MADFNTTIEFDGSRDDYLKMLEVLRFYVEDRREQYKKEANCWYLEGLTGEKCPEGEMVKTILTIAGPYGVWNGPICDEVDLFERIADVIPESCFNGNISGFDSGDQTAFSVKLEGGILQFTDSNGKFYNPKTHEYGESEYVIKEKCDVLKLLNNHREVFDDSNKKFEAKKILANEILPLCYKAGVRNLLLFEGDQVKDPAAVVHLNTPNLVELANHLFFMCERTNGSIFAQMCSLIEKIEDYNNCLSEGMDDQDPIITWKIEKIDAKKARIISCAIKSYREENIELIIPGVINGLTISEIEPNIFDMSKCLKEKEKCDGLSKIISITYPKSIKKVPGTGSVTVKRIIFEGKPTNIGDLGRDLVDFEIPESVKVIEKNAFCFSPRDTLSLPQKLERISEKAFYYSGLKEIIIPQTVKKIEEDAFRYSKLKKVVFHATNIKVDETAFRSCELLEDIVIESDSFVITGYKPKNPFEGCVALRKIVCRNSAVAEEIIKLSEESIKDKVVVEE